MGDPIPAIIEAFTLFKNTTFTIGGHTLNYLYTLITVIVVLTVLDVVVGFLGSAAHDLDIDDEFDW